MEEMFGARKDESSIDIERYLKKFIDFSMVLDIGTMNESYWEKYEVYFDKFMVEQEGDKEEITNILSKLFATVDIRRLEKLIEKANMVHSLVSNEKLDISVLVFEVMYEVLKIWKFGNLKYVAVINDGRYIDIEKRIGDKMDILKSFVVEAYENGGKYINRLPHHKYVQNNFYGKVFWYFANIFYSQEVPYKDLDGHMDDKINELEVAKKYCEFCEMIK